VRTARGLCGRSIGTVIRPVVRLGVRWYAVFARESNVSTVLARSSRD
jgi:hypothetical protein